MMRLGTLRVLAVFWALSAFACEGEGGKNRRPETGYLVVGIGAEPLTWNLHLVSDVVSKTIASRIHATLVRVNQQTQEVEPGLAESWSFSEDGTRLTFHLRADLRFSDGKPFTADDVVFTFQALHDPDVGSPLAETAKVDGEPLRPEVIDPHTVRFQLPRRNAVVERLFDGIYILPRHRLEAALADGSFVAAYGVGVPEADIVGLGPFALERYLPGQRVVLRRNQHYWKIGPQGEKLPYLDGIIFEILPDSNARVLKFSAGELDVQGGLLPEDLINLKKKEKPDLLLLDLGPGMVVERLWFNLNPKSSTVSEEKRAWFSDERFRRAISFAIDRPSIAKAVYHGLASPAVGPVSPANEKWSNKSIEAPVLDPHRAREMLREAGFHWNAEGDLVSRSGEAVSFALSTNADNRHRTQMTVLIQEDLARLGIEVRLVPLEFADLIGRITRRFDYEACLLGLTQSDPDPSAELPLWLSRAPLHFWYPLQREPATEWEARIDTLMEQQMVTWDLVERKQLYDEVQAILAEKLPLIGVVVPHALIGVNRRVQNLKPTPFWTPPLWNSEEISVDRRRD